MRYVTIISMILVFSACGNKLSTLKITGEKVSKTVSTCTEAAKNVCTELEKVSDLSMTLAEGEHENTVNSWDTHMMLW
ncbi:MAG: hypothetical protein ABI861_07920 [Panacibacter sp.]